MSSLAEGTANWVLFLNENYFSVKFISGWDTDEKAKAVSNILLAFHSAEQNQEIRHRYT